MMANNSNRGLGGTFVSNQVSRANILKLLLRATILGLAGLGIAEALLVADPGPALLVIGGLLVFQAFIGLILRVWSVSSAASLYLWGHWFVLQILFFVSGGLQSIAAFAQILLVVLAGLIGTQRSGILLAANSIILNFLSYLLRQQGLLNLPLTAAGEDILLFAHSLSMLMGVVIITIFAGSYRKTLSRIQRDDLTFRSLFEHTSDAVFLLDLEYRLLDINGNASHVLGYSRDEVIGMPLLSIVAPNEHEEVMKRFDEVQKLGTLQPTQRTFVDRAGERKILELNLAMVRDSKGKPSHFQSVGRDITDVTKENQRLKSSLADLSLRASTDPLTGIYNRKVILEHAKAEWERHLRDRKPLSVMMVDMNNLKEINDSYGHSAGDTALKRLADILEANKRKYDWLGRYGGDEFLMVLPGADSNTAKRIANRINQALKKENLMMEGKPQKLAASLGVSATDNGSGMAVSIEQLIDLADKSLYEAKRRQLEEKDDSRTK